MEKTSLDYSTKNIPVPNKKKYLQSVIHRGSKFFLDLRWRTYFFLHPAKNTNKKNNYGFKSTDPAPHVPELKVFEDKFMCFVKNLKFTNQSNHFQQKLKKDEQMIKQENKAMIKGDKSNNFYKMESKDYKELVEKEVQKEYRKATINEVKDIENTHTKK